MAMPPEAVRLVRCPYCMKVLPEVPSIPVYKCGGCNVVLQAKNAGLSAQNRNPTSAQNSVADAEEKTNSETFRRANGQAEILTHEDENVSGSAAQSHETAETAEPQVGERKETESEKTNQNIKNSLSPLVSGKDTGLNHEPQIGHEQRVDSADSQSSKTVDTDEHLSDEALSGTLNPNAKSLELAYAKSSDISLGVGTSAALEKSHYREEHETSSGNPPSKEQYPSNARKPCSHQASGHDKQAKKESLFSPSGSEGSAETGTRYQSLARIVHESEHPIVGANSEKEARGHERDLYENESETETSETGFYSMISHRDNFLSSPEARRNERISAFHKLKEEQQFLAEANQESSKGKTISEHFVKSQSPVLSKHKPPQARPQNGSVLRPAKETYFQPGSVRLQTQQRHGIQKFPRNPKSIIPFTDHDGFGQGDYVYREGSLSEIETAESREEKFLLLKKLDELREEVCKHYGLRTTLRRPSHVAERNDYLGSETLARAPAGYDDGDDVPIWEDTFTSDEALRHQEICPYVRSIPDERHNCRYLNDECVHCLMPKRSRIRPYASQEFRNSVYSGFDKVMAMPPRDERARGRSYPYNASHSSLQFWSHNVCDCCMRDHALQRSGFTQAVTNRKSSYVSSHSPLASSSHQQIPLIPQRTYHSSECCHSRASSTYQKAYPPDYQYRGRPPARSATSEDYERILHEKHRNVPQSSVWKWKHHPFSVFAGAAPFVLCPECLQLLLIPQKTRNCKKKWYKIQCGACSSVFEFTAHNKKHSMHLNNKCTVASTEDPCNFDIQENLDANHEWSCTSVTNEIVPYESDRSRAVETEDTITYRKKSGAKLGMTYSGSLNQRDKISTFHSLQQAKQTRSHNLSMDRRKGTEGSSKSILVLPSRGFPLHAHLGYTSPSEMLNKCHQDSFASDKHRKNVTPESCNHVKSFNENTNSETVEGLWNRYKGDLPRDSGKSKKAITGLLKSIKDFKKSNQLSDAARPKVTVNGQPIPDHLVLRAEEHAGPIHPGDYWYDFKAGFWGVMGEPCCAIIPPLIEEFNFPMPRNCAGGNTQILVNGRELHQKDLELLARRGLPTVKNKSYHIDINGGVVDAATNMELESLGKLAPL